ncbi:protein kinase family protein [Dictyobacter arantiisoli]|uniref:non-specific serine/threonine protein kinase n=1 Tax=Dictyobacter arantiisoli TaxID=2014874 RepID=A0A5A5T7R3_9CHLR|nr:protein kinase family protein [Dictyobacter arantiisoli]GCF06974.1 hypothetical protein KDI_05380 [Dictyobacter arantiisoli]
MTTPFCLGHPSHTLLPEESICRICGALAAHTVIGVYEVQKLLGTGKSGYAYLAQHQRSGQPVALKLFPPQAAQTELWEAARREVRIATSLRHPSILSVFSCNTWSPEQKMSSSGIQDRYQTLSNMYLLTLCQYIPGSLKHFVTYLQQAENQRALREHGTSVKALLLHVLQQIGSAVQAAHARGIVHGALLPGNILFTSYERAWVADFGLGRLQPPPAPYLPPELYAAAQASQQGNFQAYWNMANPASDQYMFAVLCQQLFSQTLHSTDYEPFLPVLNRAMHLKPERRYPALSLLVQDLLTLSTQASGIRPAQSPRPAPGNQGNQKNYPLTPPASLPPVNPRGPAGNSGSGGPRSSGVTPLPAFASGPLTPALPATPLTPTMSLTAEDWEKRGDKLFTMHDYEEALKAYHRAVEVNWNNAHTWLALGDTYFALERHKEALMAYEQAMYLNPNDAQIWLNRGAILDVLGRHQEALDCYERADQLQSA